MRKGACEVAPGGNAATSPEREMFLPLLALKTGVPERFCERLKRGGGGGTDWRGKTTPLET